MHGTSIRKERIAEIAFITCMNFLKLGESYQDSLGRTNIAYDGGYLIHLLEEEFGPLSLSPSAMMKIEPILLVHAARAVRLVFEFLACPSSFS